MPVYLPIAEMTVNAFGIISLGMIVGFFSGLFGVGGGFLSMPFLMFVGIPPIVAVTTQNCQIVASSAAGVISQWKRRRIDVPMALHMLAGGAGGILVGIGIFSLLKLLGQIDFAITAIYTLLLASIGFSMLYGIARNFIARRQGQVNAGENKIFNWLKTLPRQNHYAAADVTISIFGPMGIGFLSGLMISILGAGGGFLIVPAMIYFLGVPALMVTGTSMLQLLFLSALSCILHSLTSQSMDLVLAMLLIAGSVVGTIIGLRASKYIKGLPAHLLLAALVLAVAGRMGYDLLVAPHDLFSLVVED